MENNLKIILGEFEKYKGQIIMTTMYYKPERFVTIGDDGFDWYYITFDGRDFHWNSCVGGIIPLKGYLRDSDYNEMTRVMRLNHCDFSDKEFLISIQKEIFEFNENHKFITELCWDLIDA